MKIHFAAVSAMSLALALAAEPALAAITTVTYTGYASGYSTTSAFGGPFTDFGGSFTAQYVFDTSIGNRQTGMGSDELDGGSSQGTPSPLLSAKLTLNNATYSFLGGFSGVVGISRVCGGNCEDQIYAVANSGPPAPGAPSGGIGIFGYATGGLVPYDIEASFMTPLLKRPAGNAGMYQIIDNQFVYDFYFNLTPTTVQFEVAPVPEPSAWALMLIGLGVTGSLIRNRRRVRAVAG